MVEAASEQNNPPIMMNLMKRNEKYDFNREKSEDHDQKSEDCFLSNCACGRIDMLDPLVL